MRVKNLIAAAILTWVGLGVAAGIADGLGEIVGGLTAAIEPPAIVLVFGAFAALICFLLRHSLSRRIYSF